jgi:hypothetical protein
MRTVHILSPNSHLFNLSVYHMCQLLLLMKLHMCPFQIRTGLPAILPDVSTDIPQSLKSNAGTCFIRKKMMEIKF